MIKKIVMVIAPVDYQDYEFSIPYEIIINRGHDVVIASTKKGLCKGKFQSTVQATMTINKINENCFDGLVLVGGSGCPKAYFNNPDIIKIIRDFNETGKLLAAICIAPIVFSQSKILAGKKATVWNEDGSWSRVLEEGGAKYVNQKVVVDGNIITANGPDAAKEFANKIIDYLEKN